ncbi:MAG: YARHG domain-containing protein [Desulfocucumaceae bacterium]
MRPKIILFNSFIFVFGILLILLPLYTICLGDDFSYGGGNSTTIFPLQNNNIQMVSEKIEIEIDTINKNRDNWNVEIWFKFKNHGPKTLIDMAFPDPAYVGNYMQDGPYDGKLDKSLFLTDFKAYDPYKETFSPIVKESTVNPNLPNIPKYPRVYTWSVSFDSGGTRDIVNTYKLRANSYSNGDKALSYVLKTGALWKDDIEDFSLWIMFHRIVLVSISCDDACLLEAIKGVDDVLESGCSVGRNSLSIRSDAIYIDLKYYKPQKDIWITYVEDEPGRWRNPGWFLFTDKELADKSLDELKYMRNEIYAQHGFVFKDKSLNDLFEKKRRMYLYNFRDNYTQIYSDSLLSDYDRVNLEKIKRFEGRKKKR